MGAPLGVAAEVEVRVAPNVNELVGDIELLAVVAADEDCVALTVSELVAEPVSVLLIVPVAA